MIKFIIILSSILLFLIIVIFILSYIIYLNAIKANKELRTIDPNKIVKFKDHLELAKTGYDFYNNIEKERIMIKSYDNIDLYADFIKHDEAKATVIMLHGYRSNFLVDLNFMIKRIYDAGYNVLLPYQRGCGKSGGNCISFGIKERYDLLYWTNYLNEKSNLPIVYYGVSLGASTSVMATGFNPKNVKCVISDCGFQSPWDICVHVLKRNFHLPPFPFLYICNLYGKLFAKFTLNDYSCKEALKNNTIPILYIHGTEDDFVPLWMGKDNYECTHSKKDMLIIEGAIHAQSSLIDEKTYEKRVLDFINENIYSEKIDNFL